MKPLVIEEYREAIARNPHSYKNSLQLIANKIIKEFVGNDYEAVEVTDEDLKKKKGYLKHLSPSAKAANKKSYANGSYIANIFKAQVKALNLEDMVQVTHAKGRIFLARKELL